MTIKRLNLPILLFGSILLSSGRYFLVLNMVFFCMYLFSDFICFFLVLNAGQDIEMHPLSIIQGDSRFDEVGKTMFIIKKIMC